MSSASGLLLLVLPALAAAVSGWRDDRSRAEAFAAQGRMRQAVQSAESALAGAQKELGPQAPDVGDILVRLADFSQETLDVAGLRAAGVGTRRAGRAPDPAVHPDRRTGRRAGRLRRPADG